MTKDLIYLSLTFETGPLCILRKATLNLCPTALEHNLLTVIEFWGEGGQ